MNIKTLTMKFHPLRASTIDMHHRVVPPRSMDNSREDAEASSRTKEIKTVGSVFLFMGLAVVAMMLLVSLSTGDYGNSDEPASTLSSETPFGAQRSRHLKDEATRQTSSHYQLLSGLIDVGSTDYKDICTSISNDGKVLSIAFEQEVRVYQYSNRSGSWIPLGSPIMAGFEDEVDFPDYSPSESVALAGSALVLAVGFPMFRSGGPGQVNTYAYNAETNDWIPHGRRLVGDWEGEAFGVKISLSNDGNVLAVAAHNSYYGGEGYINLYSYDASASNDWVRFGRIDFFIAEAEVALALSGNGRRVVVGTPSYTDAGSVRVYDCIPNEITDSKECTQVGQALFGIDYEDLAGHSVALSDDGTMLAIGSPGILECSAGPPCANVRIYEYERGSESVWSQVGQALEGPIGFGDALQLNLNGSVVALRYREFEYEPIVWTEGVGPYSQVYTLIRGFWQKLGEPIKAPFLDMSKDGSILIASGENGTVLTYQYVI